MFGHAHEMADQAMHARKNLLAKWLKERFDVFELRVRAGRTKQGHDTYYCAGWADGYRAAQRDARKASAADGEVKP